MKVKKLTFSLTRKMPIEGIQYSNKESTFGMEVELSENEKIDENKIWDQIKHQVAVGLDEDEQEWLRKNRNEQ